MNSNINENTFWLKLLLSIFMIGLSILLALNAPAAATSIYTGQQVE